jgi:glycosyltransferase involved in cell wall biosynthesis
MKTKIVRILGTRGVPAAHGGFETFAEHLAPYLVEQGWQVTVYCQNNGTGPLYEDNWCGVRRIHIPIATSCAAGTLIFDWQSTLHALREPGLVLTLGYNTALFCTLYRLKGFINIINMDGIEWRRQKWTGIVKLWLWVNDWAGCWLGNHLVADHPEIHNHLLTRGIPNKITMIPYGALRIDAADAELIAPFGLLPGRYAILIARAEPENSILQIVQAWSCKPRGYMLVVLGQYAADHAFQHAVQTAASCEVIFPGAVYDKPVVQALRFYARFYVHGHQVGGTNPSLVEALGAGNAVLAHDNPYNRWVAGDAGIYFANGAECAQAIDHLLTDDHLPRLQKAARHRHAEAFTWATVLSQYETLLESWA